jgi:hypothetical protein
MCICLEWVVFVSWLSFFIALDGVQFWGTARSRLWAGNYFSPNRLLLRYSTSVNSTTTMSSNGERGDLQQLSWGMERSFVKWNEKWKQSMKSYSEGLNPSGNDVHLSPTLPLRPSAHPYQGGCDLVINQPTWTVLALIAPIPKF